jgi:osmotically-inducible protein OsmY
VGAIVGCGCSRRRATSYKESVEKALEQADVKGVSVAEDGGRNTVTLAGSLHSEQAKSRAGDVARLVASGCLVANEIGVEPLGAEADAKENAADLDDGIESNYTATLFSNHLDKHDVGFNARNGVLTGKVKNRAVCHQAEKIANGIPNVKQVVDQIGMRR